MAKEIKSNMTGTVINVLVKVGDTVSEDQDVVSMESMKMEMMVPADVSGKVTEVCVATDDFVQEGQVLLRLA
ncbi:MAG TPA: biotin/lipoyl-containing protein [Bdellovibrionota bacterium]|nr:biotin/lipoyl-containing protein [Bdellovibrionota bacterium]